MCDGGRPRIRVPIAHMLEELPELRAIETAQHGVDFWDAHNTLANTRLSVIASVNFLCVGNLNDVLKYAE